MPLYITNLYGICAFLMLLLSILIFIKDRRSPANKMYYLFGSSVFLWIVFLYLGFYFATVGNNDLSFVFGRLTYGASIWFPLFLTFFFYYFPQKTFNFSFLTKFLLVSSSAALFYITVFTPLVHESQIIEDNFWVADTFGSLYLLYLAYTIGHLLLVVGIAIHKIYKTRGIERKKTIIASSGLFVFSILALFTNVILPTFSIFLLQTESAGFSLFFLIPTYFAIQKFRFFDFNNTSLNILRYLIIIGIFLGSTFFIEYLFSIFIPTGSNLLVHIESVIVSLLLFIRMEKKFPEFMSGSFRELRSQLNQLKANIYYSNNFQDLISKIEKIFVMNLHYTTAKLYLIRDKKNKIEIPLYVRDQFSKTVEKEKFKILVKEELKLQKNDFLAEQLQKLNAAICFPIFLETKLIGFFVLGDKSEHDNFSRDELEELYKAKQAVANCFINILLQSDLSEENNLIKQFINQKTKNLKKQNEKITDLLSKQSDFIAVTAHEFRTPLNIALLQLEDTLDSYEHSSQVLDDMKSLENSLDKLKTLTQNLFDVQEYDLDKTKLYSKKINIADFMSEAYEELKNIVAKKNIELSFENLAGKAQTISIDEPKMRQVVYNLITNAQKFVPEKGKIIIRIEVKDSTLKISIIDNGPGVPANLKKRIFSKFQTSHIQNGAGIGLGLYLCKKIVELHSGKIEVSDTPGGGATFTITLPIESKSSKPKQNIKPVKQSPLLKLAKVIK